jgi:hypothetical protein
MNAKPMNPGGVRMNIGAWMLFALFALGVIAALNGAGATPETVLSPQDSIFQRGPETVAAIASAPRVRLVKSAHRATPTLEMVSDEKWKAAAQR